MSSDSDTFGLESTRDEASGRRSGSSLATHFNAIPPPGLVLISIVSIQAGAALATHLFPILGAEGTVAVRITFSALLLGLAARNRVRTFGRTFVRNWGILLVYGLLGAPLTALCQYMQCARSPAWQFAMGMQ